MLLIPIKSQLIKSGSDLLLTLEKSLKRKKERLKEGDILVIASKAVAYSQGLLVPVANEKEFKKLVRKEADTVLDEGSIVFTMKNNVLIPNAGIDNSNTPKGEVVLWPEKPFEVAEQIRRDLIKKHKLKNFGILISDSHCQPLRLGTSGIAIGWAGFEGVVDERGAKDLFGKKMQYTQIAVADDLTCAANLLMGETNASIPFVIVRGFKAKWTTKKASSKDYFITPEECLYRTFYKQKLLKS